MRSVFPRKLFVEVVDGEFNRSRRFGHTMSLLAIHLPDATEQIARQVADFLNRNVRQYDLVTVADPKTIVIMFPQTGAIRRVAARQRIATELLESNNLPFPRQRVLFAEESPDVVVSDRTGEEIVKDLVMRAQAGEIDPETELQQIETSS